MCIRDRAPTGHIPFTPRAKKVLEYSLREGLQLGHTYIGTEHILLGLIREGEGVAAQVLVKLGADLNKVRQQVIQLLAGYQSSQGEKAGAGVGQATGPAEGAPAGSLVLDQFGRNLTQAAVSYTHLDVYKRQTQSRSSAGTGKPLACPKVRISRAAHPSRRRQRTPPTTTAPTRNGTAKSHDGTSLVLTCWARDRFTPMTAPSVCTVL